MFCMICQSQSYRKVGLVSYMCNKFTRVSVKLSLTSVKSLHLYYVYKCCHIVGDKRRVNTARSIEHGPAVPTAAPPPAQPQSPSMRMRK